MIYTVETEKIENAPGTWNSLQCTVLGDGSRVGEYKRNYSSLYRSFFPFTQDGKDYALYSPHYTASRVMELPSTKDLAGEEPASFGFCPVEFFVPYESVHKWTGFTGQWGFVSGCVWGDDSSWKLQMLDLREIAAGKLTRFDPFDYLELPEHIAEAIADLTIEDGELCGDVLTMRRYFSVKLPA